MSAQKLNPLFPLLHHLDPSMFPGELLKPFAHSSPRRPLLPLEKLSWSDLDLQGQA